MHNQERKKKGDCSPTSLIGLGETIQRRARAASLLSLNFLIVGVRIVQGGGVGGVGGGGRESRQSETGEISQGRDCGAERTRRSCPDQQGRNGKRKREIWEMSEAR